MGSEYSPRSALERGSCKDFARAEGSWAAVVDWPWRGWSKLHPVLQAPSSPCLADHLPRGTLQVVFIFLAMGVVLVPIGGVCLFFGMKVRACMARGSGGRAMKPGTRT